jgi:hypothetical protein
LEERFLTLSKQVEQMRNDGAESKELEEELAGVSVSIYEEVGAPQVGVDERATEWFRKKVYEPAKKDLDEGRMPGHRVEFWSRTWEELLEEHKGQHVMELAELKGGEASVTGIAVASVDFRGKVIGYSEGLPEELQNEAYENHTGEECVAYAQRLEEALPQVSDDYKEYVQGAIDWLRFWGSRGFGYYAWY